MTPAMKKQLLKTWTPELVHELIEEAIDSAFDFGSMSDSPVTEERFQVAADKAYNAVEVILRACFKEKQCQNTP
jgi:hypothetical protein